MPLGVGPRAVIIQPLKLNFFAHPSLPTPHISSGGLGSILALVDRPVLEVWTSPVCKRGHSPASKRDQTERRTKPIKLGSWRLYLAEHMVHIAFLLRQCYRMCERRHAQSEREWSSPRSCKSERRYCPIAEDLMVLPKPKSRSQEAAVRFSWSRRPYSIAAKLPDSLLKISR